ncbi:MAG TPA: universal stress protein [Burkholderiaceae bacterium]|nr:universal stress protein [Burkholderiaceae bacterium]
MYKRILLAYDGSEEGRTALFECTDLARLAGADLHLVAVIPPLSPMVFSDVVAPDMPDVLGVDTQRFEQILKEGVQMLNERGLGTQGRLARGEPVHEICAAAKELKVELVVVGHKRARSWAQRWWRGSVGATLIDHSPCSVLVAMPPK